jgi:hypothetical protein
MIEGISLKSPLHSNLGGGNASTFHGYNTLSAAPVNEVIRLGEINGKAVINNVRMANAALGAGTQIQLGWEKLDGSSSDSNAFLPATATASASGASMSGVPVTVSDVYLTATVTGGAATGQLDVIYDYAFMGAD